MKASLFLTAACFLLSACAGPQEVATPGDEQFGHRYEGRAPDGRETVVLASADTLDGFMTFPAVLDSVHVRPALEAAPPSMAVPVEVLIKGALPDACSELNEAVQTRAENLIEVTLTMRQPRGAVCAQVVRPFRFYLTLDGTYPPGAYTLMVNGAAHPFRIRTLDTTRGAGAP